MDSIIATANLIAENTNEWSADRLETEIGDLLAECESITQLKAVLRAMLFWQANEARR